MRNDEQCSIYSYICLLHITTKKKWYWIDIEFGLCRYITNNGEHTTRITTSTEILERQHMSGISINAIINRNWILLWCESWKSKFHLFFLKYAIHATFMYLVFVLFDFFFLSHQCTSENIFFIQLYLSNFT